jgi:hypothetical protein
VADEVREVRFDFSADVTEMVKGTEQVKTGMETAGQSISLGAKILDGFKGSAQAAAAQAAAMATEWVAESVQVASSANKIAKNFEAVFEGTDVLSDEIEELAGHMGLAEHEAKALLAEVGALGQSMGMSREESALYAEEMFRLAGDMAAFNPEVGNAADAMEALTKAANGSTKSMAEWGVSLKNSEITALALEQTGKTLAAQLTQEDKARAVLTLTMQKQADAQGQLNADIAAGNTEVKEANADIQDMQVVVGQALMPIKKLAFEGIKVLADMLIALEPAITAVGEVLMLLFEIIKPLLPVVSALASLLGGALSRSITQVTNLLKPFLDMVKRVTSAVGSMINAIGNIRLPSLRMPSFHSGGRVPGAEGTLQPIMAQGGETIGRPGSGSRGAAAPSTVVNITVNAGIASPQDTAREIADLLTEYSAIQGGLDIKVRS